MSTVTKNGFKLIINILKGNMLLCSKVSMALNENNDSVIENQVLLYVFLP